MEVMEVSVNLQYPTYAIYRSETKTAYVTQGIKPRPLGWVLKISALFTLVKISAGFMFVGTYLNFVVNWDGSQSFLTWATLLWTCLLDVILAKPV